MYYRVFGVTAFFMSLIGISCALAGLVMFANYKHCDPLNSGQIFSMGQVLVKLYRYFKT